MTYELWPDKPMDINFAIEQHRAYRNTYMLQMAKLKGGGWCIEGVEYVAALLSSSMKWWLISYENALDDKVEPIGPFESHLTAVVTGLLMQDRRRS